MYLVKGRRPCEETIADRRQGNDMTDPDFRPEDLPDGACIAPLRVTAGDTDCTAVRDAAYIGSFAVIGPDHAARRQFVTTQLEEMRSVTRSKPILLVISLSGLKVCSANGESVYMAHSMKRISYATCDPEYCQFSFLAREPKGQMNVQYCHAFITKTPELAEELNVIVGNTFKMAYAAQKTEKPMSFNDMIEQQLQQQKAKFSEKHEKSKSDLDKRLSQISQTGVLEMATARKEMRRRQSVELELEKERERVVGKNKIWAKQTVTSTRHRLGMPTEGRTESPPPPLLRQTLDLEPTILKTTGSPVVALKESIDNQETLQVQQRLANHLAREERLNGHRDGRFRSDSRERNASGGRSTDGRHRNDSGGRYRADSGNRQRTDRTDGAAETDGVVLRQHSDPQGSSTLSRLVDMTNRPLPEPPGAGDESDKSDDSFGRMKNAGQGPSNASSSSSSRSGEPGASSSPRLTRNGRKSPGTIKRYMNDSHLRGQIEFGEPGNYLDQSGLPPPLPERLDSLRRYDLNCHPDDSCLRQASWYQAGIPREIALEILAQEEMGSFIVRDSTTHPDCYALSVKVPKFDNPSGISHYLITRTSRGGYRLKGLEKEWPSLVALVTHHTVMQEMLPCTLQLPRNTSNPTYNETERDDKDEDEDYQRLSDFTSMMADLKMDK